MKRRCRRFLSTFLVSIVLLGMLVSAIPLYPAAQADTLTIQAGYFGLPFVTKAQYSVSDMEAIGVSNALYTMNSNGGFLAYAEAEGVLIADLLENAGISVSQINYVNFKASDGHNASKNYYLSTLLAEKYAFPTVSQYYSKQDGVTDTDAVWESAVVVPGMLAIQDNYGRVSDFSEYREGEIELNSTHRFRLMLGQDYPGQTVASDSIYDINMVMVTYEGSPSLHAASEMEVKVGENQTLEVSVDSADQAISQMITEGLTYSSSDSSVVKVDSDGKLIPVGKGEAEITIRYQATDIDASDLTTTVKIVVGEDENNEGGGEGSGMGTGTGTGSGSGSEGNAGSGSGSGDDVGNSNKGDQDGSGTGTGGEGGSGGETGNGGEGGQGGETGNEGEGTPGAETGKEDEDDSGSEGKDDPGTETGKKTEEHQKDDSQNPNRTEVGSEKNDQDSDHDSLLASVTKDPSQAQKDALSDLEKEKSKQKVENSRNTQKPEGETSKILKVRRVKMAGSSVDSQASSGSQNGAEGAQEGGSVALSISFNNHVALLTAAGLALLLFLSGGVSMYRRYQKEIER